jgi:soluble lytic murein transglycosylase-like protein
MVPLRWDKLVYVKAQEHGIDPALLRAIALVESGGEPNRALAYRHEPGFWTRYLAKHPIFGMGEERRISASYGHCQVLYVTATEHGYLGEPEGLAAPSVNAEFACRILRGHLKWALGAQWAQHLGVLTSPAPAGPIWTGLQAAIGAYNGGRGLPGGKVGPWPAHATYIAKVRSAALR